MKIRRFYGKDMREALNAVRQELGGDAVIMSNKKVADGVEIVAAYDKEPQAAKKSVAKPSPSTLNKNVPSLSEIIGDSGPDSLKALLEKQAQDNPDKIVEAKPKTNKTSLTTQKPSVVNSVGDTNSMEFIRKELHSLRNVLQFQVAGLLQQEKHRQHPMYTYLVSRLQAMGIDDDLAQEVVTYTPEGTDERQAWLFLLKLLANRLATIGNDILSQHGVVALVGPTGTGKTTTIAKLAAKYAQKYGPEQVALVTIDSYRIAAYEQLATYAKIIGCQVRKAHSAQDLSDVLIQLRSKRLVLIDTAGFGQRDTRLIKQLDTFNQQSCANIKKYLVVQANSQLQVIERTISSYKQISLRGCIFTKLDECYSLGEAISASIKQGLPVSYITDGQKVPEDIKVADAKTLISMAAKLYKKYGITHTKSQHMETPAMAV